MVSEVEGTAFMKSGERLELVCVNNGFDVIRARVPPDGPAVIVRTGLSQVRPVAAEIFTLDVERSWIFGHTRHLKGLITGTQLQVERLELEPLELYDSGTWDPAEHEWIREDDVPEFYDEILTTGPRPAWEMEQVLPEDAVTLRWEEDPILEAVALGGAGYTGEAESLLGDLLTADLRCLDAHAHLGNLELRRRWPGSLDRAARHFRAGLEIADLSLGAGFQDVLPWGLIDNRPYLRCLHGYGLALWQRGEAAAAAQVFRRMLWLNPDDNQGARFLIGPVEEGVSWETFDEQDPRG